MSASEYYGGHSQQHSYGAPQQQQYASPYGGYAAPAQQHYASGPSQSYDNRQPGQTQDGEKGLMATVIGGGAGGAIGHKMSHGSKFKTLLGGAAVMVTTAMGITKRHRHSMDTEVLSEDCSGPPALTTAAVMEALWVGLVACLVASSTTVHLHIMVTGTMDITDTMGELEFAYLKSTGVLPYQNLQVLTPVHTLSSFCTTVTTFFPILHIIWTLDGVTESETSLLHTFFPLVVNLWEHRTLSVLRDPSCDLITRTANALSNILA
ncbi:hypothetical protein J7T55_004815 [Diaporthe amygdali]|uniref:uncharacterized protein n=1 Tax=Phomopsis amygdali TaxID=1214568 RepID=UPI0022FE39A9|nr:uncharacterized protein J7T55_004815 [Diaporthe amygdali]KAJ0114571.1 hypothetical protein J7T55_004815 [Diaporthe amygdali]